MIVFHTTFHLSDSVYVRGMDYLRSEYIPRAVRSGKLHHPRLQRVLTESGSEGVSVAVQFLVADQPTLDAWLRTDGVALRNDMRELFQDEVAGFSTLLEELDL